MLSHSRGRGGTHARTVSDTSPICCLPGGCILARSATGEMPKLVQAAASSDVASRCARSQSSW